MFFMSRLAGTCGRGDLAGKAAGASLPHSICLASPAGANGCAHARQIAGHGMPCLYKVDSHGAGGAASLAHQKDAARMAALRLEDFVDGAVPGAGAGFFARGERDASRHGRLSA